MTCAGTHMCTSDVQIIFFKKSYSVLDSHEMTCSVSTNLSYAQSLNTAAWFDIIT